MQAYYEIETDIPLDHQLKLALPNTIPVGKAKITVSYEIAENLTQTNMMTNPTKLTDFLGAGKAYSRFDTVKEIDDFIAQNREAWDV